MSLRWIVLITFVERALTLFAIHLALGGPRWPLAGVASLCLCHLAVLAFVAVRQRLWRAPREPKTLLELAAERATPEGATSLARASALAESWNAAVLKSGFDPHEAMSLAFGWAVGMAAGAGIAPEELGRQVTTLARSMQPVCDDCARGECGEDGEDGDGAP